MNKQVRVLKRAQSHLEEVQRYVQRDRPAAASRVVARLLDRIESLEEPSDHGVVPKDERLARLGYRVLVEDELLVFYKVLRTQVRVYGVLHGRRRYGRLI